MKLGIVGLPNVGKSTLFNAITKAEIEAANYPFATIEPNVGVVSLPDERLNKIKKIYDSQKIIPTTVEFYDIAGLVKGASKGEGLGNKFLSHIREVEAIVHVVRCFKDENIVHVDGTVDPIRDIETINVELILSDLETLEKRIEKTERVKRTGDKEAIFEYDTLIKVKDHLEAGHPVRSLEKSEEEKEFIKGLFLLTSKDVLYALNVSEDDVVNNTENDLVKLVREYVETEKAGIVTISGRLEEELSGLEDDEKEEMLKEYGIVEPGLDKLIKESYRLLGLISFITAGPKEVRAWTIKEGTKAPIAAGKIHSDIERGFIRAEVMSYDDLIESGSEAKARERGVFRIEGKDYIIKDGDICNFRFNV